MRLVCWPTPVFAALAAAALLAPSHALAEGPRLTYTSMEDGDTVAEKPFVVQLCFAEPVNIRDRREGGDFAFTFTLPNGFGLGYRTVFQPDGYGVAIYPGEPAPGAEIEGQWTFAYRVTEPDTLEPTEGEVRFTVDPGGGEPIIRETPGRCSVAGGPVQTTPGPDDERRSPGLDDGEGDGPDVALLVLLTLAGATGLVVLGFAAYVFRHRIGFNPHVPEDGESGGCHEH